MFLWLLFGRDNRAAAAWLLAALGATDWVDGYIARHFDQVSELGKVLDPVADRLLFFVGVGAHPDRRLGAGLVRLVAVLVREVARRRAPTLALAAAGRGASTSRGSARPARSGSWWRSRCSWRRTRPWAGTPAVAGRWPGASPASRARAGLVRRRVPTCRWPGGPWREGRAAGLPRMKAVIMAGGEGTRLRPLTSNCPSR